MKIVGVSRCDFVANDGTHVKGFNVYLEKPLDSGAEAIGVMTQNIYLSESKMNMIAEVEKKEITIVCNAHNHNLDSLDYSTCTSSSPNYKYGGDEGIRLQCL